MADAQNRTLPASAKKIAKARGEGQVARSRDLGHLAAVGVGTLLVIALLPHAILDDAGKVVSGLTWEGRAAAGVGVWMITWWLTETGTRPSVTAS